MKINSRIHGIIDYLIIIFLFLSPSVFGVAQTTSIFCYGLAVIHLVMTICTNYEYSLTNFIPFKIHGKIELFVSLALVVVAFYLGTIDGFLSKELFIGLAIFVFVLWLISDYTNKPESTRDIPYVESNSQGGMI
ncbi:hypothetical protein [Pedobacter arcticus]|uniref:hypothetical protein n=1 Tax=Pedobacter arcticus TaxID=752140 RepID=UPI00037628D3|nr:hypothetical protein [Pedobacter arcticus]